MTHRTKNTPVKFLPAGQEVKFHAEGRLQAIMQIHSVLRQAESLEGVRHVLGVMETTAREEARC